MAIHRLFAGAAACLLISGCAYHAGSADYRGYEAMGEQHVRFGVVEAVRDVRIRPGNTGVGSTAGAFIGGIAGSHVGGGSGEIVGAIAGTVIGSIIGYNVEQQANEIPGIEVTVLLDSGKYIAVVQQAGEPFRTGDRVRVLSGRDAVRVTH
jgi:outer membrane lipoprotein SlyB